MANKRFIDFPIATTVGDNDIILIWQSGANKQTTKATILSGVPDSLNDLTDVTISGLTNGQILRYDSVSGQWENTDQGNLDLNDLNDVTIVSPTNGQVLVYNSTTSKWENSSGGYVPYIGAVTTVNLGAQTIQAGSFVKQGGTASQFLKANGSVDSTAYGTGSVTSVALTMPTAFSVAGSPITTAGTFAVTGAGTVAQYIRGDGSLADFPESSGGGSSVSYYLNGSVAQGTIGGIAYKELSKVPILGAGTDFTINADGYIASFITDAGDPNLLEIPGGNWNFETYFSASSGGGSPTFYVELYKVNAGGTATLIASSSTSPELIAFGTNLTPYFSSLAVPTTTLALTDRLAVRYYVTHSGRTITLHTENNHLCQIITTFTTGLTALNGLTAQVQNFAVGTTGTDFNIASAVSTHTFNLPTASATNRGALSSADWALFTQAYNDKINSAAVTGTTTKTLTLTQQDGGTITASWSDLNTDAVLSVFGRTGNVIAVSGDYTTAQVTESGNLYYTDARSRAALSFAAGSGAYNTSTGVITIPTNNNQIANGAGYITSAALAGYLPLTGGTLTGPLNGTTASFSGSITVSTNNASGGGIILADDGDIVDLNDGFASMRFSLGVRIFSANRGGTPVITLGDTGYISANGNITGANLSGTNTGDVTIGTANGLSLSGQALSLGLSSGSVNGALSSSDWTTFNNKANANGSNASGTWGINITGNSTAVVNTVTGTNSAELVRGNMADNDQFRILIGGTGSNAGFAEIATADDGTEPIFVRQYTGVFTSLVRTLTLLDGSGNTNFPGKVGINTSSILNNLGDSTLQLGTTMNLINIANQAYLQNNWNYVGVGGTPTHIINGFSSRFLLAVDGSFVFTNTSSGTANTAIVSEFERMKITQGGNVLINTNGADNGARFQVSGNATFSGAYGTSSGVYLSGSTYGVYGANRGASSASAGMNYFSVGSQRWFSGIYENSDNFGFYSVGTSGFPLTLSYSTGAATFSSSVTATNALFNSTSTQLILQNVNGGTNAERIGMFMTSGDIFKILSLNDNNTTRVDNIITANVLNGNVGIGTPSPAYSLDVVSSGGIIGRFTGNSGAYLILRANGVRDWWLANGVNSGTDGWFSIYNATAGSQGLVITSTNNVLIGTATDNGHKLAINAGGTSGLRIDVNSGVSGLSMSPGAEFNIDKPGVGGGTFKINSAGRVGIGTASILNNIGDATLQLGTTMNLINIGNQAYMQNNWNYVGGGTPTHIINGFSSRFLLALDGSFIFTNTSSGSANTTIATEFERMKITQGGNVLIGAPSDIPAARLNVNGSIRTANPDRYVAGNWRLGRALIGIQPANTHQIIVEIDGGVFSIAAASV
jgi:hypothetical protein